MSEPPPIPQSNLRRRSIRYGLAAIALFILALLALDRQTPPVLDRARQTSALLLDSQDHILRGFTTSQGTWRLPAQTTEVDPLYLRMLLAYEDQRFPSHPGVDPLAVARAA